MILPSAVTYSRRWVNSGSLVVPDYETCVKHPVIQWPSGMQEYWKAHAKYQGGLYDFIMEQKSKINIVIAARQSGGKRLILRQ